MEGLTQDRTEIQFLELLRSGLSSNPANPSFFDDKTNWEKIQAFATMQAVTPLVYEGIASLPEGVRPPTELLFKLIAFIDRVETLNGELDCAAGELSSKLEAEGIKSVLLKGQGNALFYPNPARRQCGDIDLYVGRENYYRSKELLGEWCETDLEHIESEKHSSFKMGHLSIELHRIAFELSLSDRSFREWEQASLMGSETTVTLGGKQVYVPEPTFNAFYIFAHAFHHFMTAGIGLRQLCDMGLLLKQLHGEIDGEELGRRLKLYGLEKDWAYFCRLCCEDLGMEAGLAFTPDCMGEKALAKAKKFHDFIFDEGNFGQFKKGEYYFDKPYLIRKFISFYKHNQRYFNRFSISPWQTVRHYWETLSHGMSAVMKRR